MTQPINVAIIGAGIGAEHLKGYLAIPHRYRVKILCDKDEQRAKRVLEDHPEISIEDDFDEVLSDDEIDLVDICLPPHLHFECSMAALSAGKHVICEKPLVSSLRDADILADHALKCGKVLTPVFQYRYGLAAAQLHALIENGLTGEPRVATIETHWDRREDYYSVPWRGTWKGEQGGAVLGHAIHNHDLLCTFFGPVGQLSAFASTLVNDIEVEDCATIAFMMQNGAMASSSVTLGAAENTTRFRFVFEKLTAESGLSPYKPVEDTWMFIARDKNMQSQIDDCLRSVSEVNPGFTGFFEALADALENKGGREVSVADGRRSLELVSAIYHAVRNNCVVRLPLSEGHPLYDGWSL